MTNNVFSGTLNPTHFTSLHFPYSIPCVGPGADPGVQAVSPQVTVKSTRR